MKKIFTFFLALVASAGTLFAESGTCGDNLKWELNSSGVLTISGSGDMTDWVIETAPWYSSRSSIKTVKIGNSVTSIGRYAFYNCNNISSVTIGSSVKSINYYAFKNCYNLLSVIIPNSVTSIGNEAFHTCSSLASVSIGESVTSFGTNVFQDCNNLEYITWNAINCPDMTPTPFYSLRGNISSFVFGSNVQKIPASLCYGMTKLKSITIHSNVTSIGNQAFYNCTGLKTIVWNAINCDAMEPFTALAGNITSFTFGNEVESIPNNICKNMNRLTEITIPNSAKSIGGAAFYGCSGLTSVTIGNGVTSIGYNAFNGCSGLTSITIPAGVTSISGQAFYNCSGLTSVTIGESVTSMGADVFYNCSALKTITWNAKNYSAVNPFASAASSITSFTFGSAVESIPSNICQNMNRLTEITIPNSVKSIGGSAFYGCTSLKTIVWNAKNCSAENPFAYSGGAITSFTIGNGVESLPVRLCVGMKNLTEITIPNSVKSIGDYAFASCSGLTSVTIPSNVTTIGECAFQLCTGLTSITSEATTPPTCGSYCFHFVDTSIPLYVPAGTAAAYKAKEGWKDFGNILLASGTCGDNLTWVLDGDGVLTIKGTGKMTGWVQGKNVPWYDYRASIKSVVIEAGVTSIGSLAFNGYSSIASVTIPAGITYIGSYAFYGCTGLKSITIPDGVTTLDEGAFQACTGFTTITLPASVNTLGENALSGCSGLQSITCEATTPPHCDDECFVGVTKSIPVYVPYGTVDAYNNENYWNYFTNILEMSCYLGSGTCGASDDNLTWSLPCSGVLTISGTGKMADYTSSSAPWNAHKASINSVVISDGVTGIGESAFENCSNMTSVTLPNSVISVGAGAFRYCSGLTSPLYNENVLAYMPTSYSGAFVVPEGIKSIAGYAFSGCNKISSVTIPNSVTSLGKGAFYECTGIQSITSRAATPPACGSNCFYYVPKTIPVYVPAGTVADYKAKDGWKDFGDNIQEIGADQVAYELVDLSKESIAEGEYLIVFDDNKAHAKVSGSDLAASSDELTIVGDVAYVPKETACAVTIAPLGTDSFSIRLADGTTYLDLQKKNSVATSATASAFAITDGGNKDVEIAKYLPSESKTYVLKHNGNYFRMYSNNLYTLPKLYRKKIVKYTITWKMDDGTVIDQTKVEAGVVPTHADPTKAATAEYTYTFAGWEPKVVAVTGDATYTATFKETKNSYTITWKMDDGSVIAKETYAYGDMPSHAAPVKESTAQYTYTFTGWTPALTSVTGDATYTAVFSATERSYTVTWLNWDGAELAKETYAYGLTPSYNGAVPVRPATEQFSYTFTGWTPAVVPVSGDATYTAVFKETKNSYTITWKMDDGSVIAQENYNYGDMPSHAAPVKEATAQYTYTFTGWTPALTSVTGDATYTAVFSATERSYTVTWLNWDGSQLAKESYKYGATPSFKGATPSRPATAQNTFTFTGWSPAIAPVSGDVTYKAQFSATGQTYTITWKMDDGSVIAKETYAYGDMPNHTAPVKEATTQYTYTFEGWTPAVVAVTSDATYTAVFKAEVRNYTVSWLNWDGSELAKESYAYGTQPAYKGATPTRPATEQFSYTFTGWTPAVAKVTGDVTYTATFKEATNTFTITWKMDDGSVIAKETYAYGDMPSQAAPVKEQTAQYTYTFSGWNPAIVPVTEDATYTAVFKATVRSYKVTFLDKDGKEIEVQEVLYNEAAVAPQAPEVEGYVFIGWDTPFDAVKSDLTVKALYEEVKDYTPSNLNALLVPKADDVQITLSWDKVEGAVSYELRVLADDVELFSQNTMTQNIISSPLSDIVNTYKITPGTYTMTWFVRSTDALGHAISDWAEGPQFEVTVKGQGYETTKDEVQSVKIYRNGRFYILRGDKTYTLTGQLVR